MSIGHVTGLGRSPELQITSVSNTNETETKGTGNLRAVGYQTSACRLDVLGCASSTCSSHLFQNRPHPWFGIQQTQQGRQGSLQPFQLSICSVGQRRFPPWLLPFENCLLWYFVLRPIDVGSPTIHNCRGLYGVLS